MIYTFGLILWSIFSRGALPFSDLCCDQLCSSEFRRIHSLTMPTNAPKDVIACIERYCKTNANYEFIDIKVDLRLRRLLAANVSS
jgi:hypothetical protein